MLRLLRLDTRHDPAHRLGWAPSRLDATFAELLERVQRAAAEERRAREEAKAKVRLRRQRLALLKKRRKGHQGRKRHSPCP